MAVEEEIGTLSKVGIRKVWQDEAKDFTPWLAKNPDLLGKELGMDLEHIKTEAAVGRYSADLVFHNESQKVVVVENMFNDTDHDHLGKLITYAAGLGAAYAVLISPEFREEHRSALTWLNSISAEDFGFFGVALEVWRIGNSLPAPRLRVEVKPDGWLRSVRATQRAKTGRELLYLRFWDEFLPALVSECPGWTRRNKPTTDSWMQLPTGRTGLSIIPCFCKPEDEYRLRVELYIDVGDAKTNKAAFERLHEQKARIEEDLGEALDWDRLDDRKGARISLYYAEGIEVSEEEKWPAARNWLVDAAGRMRQVFAPAIRDLPR